MLYIRMFISMLVGLYTSRVVLATLGVEDYGIYGVVGGVVGMMGFLNASMSGATSRFLTFELGKGDKERLAKTFSSALIVHIGIAIVVLILAETVGLWFLSNKLNIPAERMQAAHWVYQLSILSAMFGITQVPYNAAIIANEKMEVYAYVEILNVSLKLLIVYLLCIGNFDKLILYASLMLAVSILIMMVYRIYAIRHFPEAHFHWIWDKTYLRPLLSFSGWDLYGNMAFTIRQQGSVFLINIFYGVALNAACNIASTVQGILLQFSSNVVLAFKPAIIKQYAQDNLNEMNQLLRFSTKISTCLLSILSIAILIKMDYILKLWLGIVPDGAVVLTKISLIINYFSCLASILIIGIHATGKVFKLGAFNGTLYILNIPVMYIMLKIGFGYRACYIMFVISSFLFCVLNLYILHIDLKGFQLRKFVIQAILPSSLAIISSYLTLNFISKLFPDTFFNFVMFVLVSIFVIVFLWFLIMLNKNERASIISYFNEKIKR